MRPLGIVCHATRQVGQERVELRCRLFVDRLRQVVVRGVIALCQPLAPRFVLERIGGPPEFHRERGNTGLHETVLVGACERIPIGFRVSGDFDMVFRAYRAHFITEGGFGESLHVQFLQREERHEHVEIEVGADRGLGYGRSAGKVT